MTLISKLVFGLFLVFTPSVSYQESMVLYAHEGLWWNRILWLLLVWDIWTIDSNTCMLCESHSDLPESGSRSKVPVRASNFGLQLQVVQWFQDLSNKASLHCDVHASINSFTGQNHFSIALFSMTNFLRSWSWNEVDYNYSQKWRTDSENVLLYWV